MSKRNWLGVVCFLILTFLCSCSDNKDEKEVSMQVSDLIAQLAKHDAVEESPSMTAVPQILGNETTKRIIKHGDNAVPELLKALNSDDPNIVIYSAFCLGEIGSPEAVPEMQKLVNRLSQEVEAYEKEKQALTYANWTMAIMTTTRTAIRKIEKSLKQR